MNTRPHPVTYQLFCLALLLYGGLPGCTGVSSDMENSTTVAAVPVRIIVGFNSPDIRPEDPAIIQAIQDKLAMELTLIRKLSANTAVYAGNRRQTEAALKQRLQQLTSIPYIRYAELDQRRRI